MSNPKNKGTTDYHHIRSSVWTLKYRKEHPVAYQIFLKRRKADLAKTRDEDLTIRQTFLKDRHIQQSLKRMEDKAVNPDSPRGQWLILQAIRQANARKAWLKRNPHKRYEYRKKWLQNPKNKAKDRAYQKEYQREYQRKLRRETAQAMKLFKTGKLKRDPNFSIEEYKLNNMVERKTKN